MADLWSPFKLSVLRHSTWIDTGDEDEDDDDDGDDVDDDDVDDDDDDCKCGATSGLNGTY